MEVPLPVAAVVGAIVAYKVLCMLASVYAFTLRPGKDLRKYGEWAVVTGATDGIGKALAKELASKGLNVFLISRTESKLVEVEQELVEAFGSKGRKFAHLAVDYSGGFDQVKRAKVAAALAPLDVGILANNVGMSYSFTKFYHELTDADAADLVALNYESTVFMTKIALGDASAGMISRKRGAIINTSSAAGTTISPLLAGYSGVKGGIVMFSKSLAAELKPLGIDVQVQTPLFVVTKLAKIRKSSVTVPTPASYAKAAVAAIGHSVETSPYWSHALQLWLMDLLPEFVSVAIVSSMHHGIRKAGMKKEMKKAAESGDSSKKAQ